VKETKIKEVNKGYQMKWKDPDELDLTVRRQEFRNKFGYADKFVEEYDLF
jgi:hypothetical protein